MNPRAWTVGILVVLASAGATAGIPDLAYTVALAGDAEPISVLHRIDLFTGELTAVGETPLPAAGLAFNTGGDLFGVDSEANVILQIDLETGRAEAVSALDVDLGGASNVGLAFTSDGRLWMVAFVDDAYLLFVVDPATGAAQAFGTVEEPFAGGLAVVDGTLYAMGHDLGTVNLDTGQITLAQTLDFAGFRSIGMAGNGHGKIASMQLCTVCMAPFDIIWLLQADPAGGEWEFTGSVVPPCTRGLAVRPWVRDTAEERSVVSE